MNLSVSLDAGRATLGTLSQQAGRDLVRYTQEQRLVTVPAIVTGSAEQLSATVDVGGLAQRAIRNEIQKAIRDRLGGLFK